MEQKKKVHKYSLWLLLIPFILGMCLMLYPTVSNYWNSFHSSIVIDNYADKVVAMNHSDYEQLFKAAYEYNQTLALQSKGYYLTDTQKADYEVKLNINNDGIMGVIEIPGIYVELPIYHGSAEQVLQVAAGHLDWTSLPVGGESSHCVLSGHSGLPSAKLFTDLDKLALGDTFMLHVLNKTLTYEVDQILIVNPQDTSALQIVEGEDYCTLVTCTPYGINTHRLLVRGHRIEGEPKEQIFSEKTEGMQIKLYAAAVILVIVFLSFAAIILVVRNKRRRRLH
ncbi:MAG: class C sortase [Frisingicoccus sp.]|uniref:class C sortase n=1 Tax=Frisingicoccus sp. TaxID=1918627 RepID=UPI002A7FB233|nr:class C sortase [Frisingicoccus sp.]MDY4833544.1 class C sortase [Frisingicoccus sp.]